MNQPSGLFLPFKFRRRFLFIFGHSDLWVNKYLKGYTHVVLAEFIDGFLTIIEPTLSSARVIFRTMPRSREWLDYGVLEVVVSYKDVTKNNLIGFKWQTCATVVQYLAGINTGALLAQTLYKRLLTRKYPGVEVRKWEQSQVLSQ